MRVPLACVRFKHNCFVFEYDFRYPAFASNVNASLNAVNAEFLKLKLRRFQNSFALWRRPFSVRFKYASNLYIYPSNML